MGNVTVILLTVITVSFPLLVGSAALLLADRRRPRYVGRHRAIF